MSLYNGLTVTAANSNDGASLGKLRIGVQLLHVVALVGGVLSLVFLAFADWNIVEALALASGQRQSMGKLIPLTALILATLGSWSLMYLLHDKLGILGSARARKLLKPRADALCLKRNETPLSRHFVELRPRGRRGPFRVDWGWLLLFSDRLEFVGDRQCITLPKTLVAGPPEPEPSAKGLLPTWLDLPVREDWKGVAFLCRDSARSLSDTSHDAEVLRVALVAWLKSKA